jgi:hypothetical protein
MTSLFTRLKRRHASKASAQPSEGTVACDNGVAPQVIFRFPKHSAFGVRTSRQSSVNRKILLCHIIIGADSMLVLNITELC